LKTETHRQKTPVRDKKNSFGGRVMNAPEVFTLEMMKLIGV
jgi:hypothetical protein